MGITASRMLKNVAVLEQEAGVVALRICSSNMRFLPTPGYLLLLTLQLGADLGYLLCYYRKSRGIRFLDISSYEVRYFLQIDGETLEIG